MIVAGDEADDNEPEHERELDRDEDVLAASGCAQVERVKQRDDHDHGDRGDLPRDVEPERGEVVPGELAIGGDRLREPDDQGREAGDVAEQRMPQRREVAVLAAGAWNRVRDRGVRASTAERGNATDEPGEQDVCG